MSATKRVVYLGAIIRVPRTDHYVVYDKNREIYSFATEPKIGAHGWVSKSNGHHLGKLMNEEGKYWLHSKRAVEILQEVKGA